MMGDMYSYLFGVIVSVVFIIIGFWYIISVGYIDMIKLVIFVNWKFSVG